LPRWLGWAGLALGPILIVLCGLSLLLGGRTVAFAGFVADGAWIGLAGLALLMPAGAGRAAGLAWLVFFTVSVAAGVSGLALLAFPGSTAGYFSWPLAPDPAATIGACYLVASTVYGLALRRGGPAARWGEARWLLIGVLALSVPIFVATLTHLEVFPFARWQAWAWVLLFGLFPVAALTALWWGRDRGSGEPAAFALIQGGYRLAGLVRAARWPAVAYAALVLALAAVLLLWPRLARDWPIGGPVFRTMVLGAWFALAGVCAIWTAVRPAVETRVAVLALWLFPVAWLVAPLR
jgi:hypothetical protein